MSNLSAIEPLGAAASAEARLRQTAQDLEGAFLTEMLKHAGLAEAFGAQETGEGDAFAGFLLEALSDQIIEQGGLGLADRFYAELSAREGEQKDGSVKL